jgi:hypothetical protein
MKDADNRRATKILFDEKCELCRAPEMAKRKAKRMAGCPELQDGRRRCRFPFVKATE